MIQEGSISVPVPLKHHTETAYIILLALVAALSGFVASLLPHLPVGLAPWIVCMVLSIAYPLVLSGTFRENRADYEFRALHWFPAFIFAVWMFFEFVGSKAKILHILQLGFFFLWSLPLVALTIAFLILFSLHVIRRWIPRVALLSLILILFTVGSVAAEAWNVNPGLQRTLFAEKTGMFMRAQEAASRGAASLISLVRAPETSSGDLVASVTTSSRFAASSVSSVNIDGLQMRSSIPPIIGDRKPKDLSASGPEDIAILLLTILAVYSMTLHIRARRRISA